MDWRKVLYIIWIKGKYCMLYGLKESIVYCMDWRKVLYIVWIEGKYCILYGLEESIEYCMDWRNDIVYCMD